MKKLLILLTILTTVATCLVAGCVNTGETYIDQNETINTSVGQDFIIALDANPTTGYEWIASYDDSILTLTHEEYDAEKCPGLIGAGGTYYFGFEALKKGETEITVDYLREWEGESIDQRVFTVNIK
jgi:inhibitor of cysteine peptidase